MNSTTFRNPHGLPDSGQVTTARDLARLGAGAAGPLPDLLQIFRQDAASPIAARAIRNHNRLLGSVEGVDGIKTGYTRASGFNLVTNVKRDGRHIIAVVMGGKTAGQPRRAHARADRRTICRRRKRGARSAPLLVADASVDDAGDTPPPRPCCDAAEALVAMRARRAPARRSRRRRDRARLRRRRGTDDVVAAGHGARRRGSEDATEGDVSDADESSNATIRSPTRIQTATRGRRVRRHRDRGRQRPIRSRKLTELARIRAGVDEIIAGPAARPRDVRPRDEAGWHIQIGAVPTAEGAAGADREGAGLDGPGARLAAAR